MKWILTLSICLCLIGIEVYGQGADQILFYSNRNDSRGIYSMDLNGNNPMQLIATQTSVNDLDVSPDGLRIAYIEDKEPIITNIDGTNPIQYETCGITWKISWAPDGRKLAIDFRPEETRLRNEPGCIQVPPTSDLIYTPDPADGWFNDDIYILDLADSRLTRLTDNPAAERNPTWSPDGSQILFSSNRDGNTELYVMNIDGLGEVNLTNNPTGDGGGSWSPDGLKIAFATDRDGNDEIYVMDRNGANVANLTNHPALDSVPVWSPDGTSIAFFSSRDPRGIYIMDADGSNIRSLTDASSWNDRPTWVPGNRPTSINVRSWSWIKTQILSP